MTRRLCQVGVAIIVAMATAACVDSAATAPTEPANTLPSSTASPPPATRSAEADIAPAALLGRVWVASTSDGAEIVGRIGSGQRVDLPPRTRALASLGSSVLIAERTAGDGSLLRVTNLDTGVNGADISSLAYFDNAIPFGSGFLVTGQDLTTNLDPGIYRLESGNLTRLLDPDRTGPTLLSRSLLASPSGDSVVSPLCQLQGPCRIDVLDPMTGVSTRRLDVTGSPTQVWKSLLVVRATQNELFAIDIGSGSKVWSLAGDEFGLGYLTSDGGLILQSVHAPGPTTRIVRVAMATGRSSTILERPISEDWTLWPELSTDGFAVLGHGGTFDTASSTGNVISAALVELTTGTLQDDAVRFTVRP